MSDATTPRRPSAPDLAVAPPRRLPSWWWAPVAVLGVLLLVWWMASARDLPVRDGAVEAGTKAGTPVYVGLTTAGVRGSRDVALRSVELGDVPDGAQVEALVCLGGSVTVTADADPFCEELVAADGASLSLPGDQLILSVTADGATTVELPDLEVSYREGLQWGGQQLPDVVVEVVA